MCEIALSRGATASLELILKVVTKGDSNLLEDALTDLCSIDGLALRFG
jgi:hypothetical protein